MTVLVGDFEALALPQASCELVIAAMAFHWLDPATRYVGAARILRPGGALAPFRSEHVLRDQDDGFFVAAQAVYARVLPEWAAAYRGLPRPDEVAEAARIAASGFSETPVVGAISGWSSTTRRGIWRCSTPTPTIAASRRTCARLFRRPGGADRPRLRRADHEGVADDAGGGAGVCVVSGVP